MQLAISIMDEIEYPEFRQKLIDLVREVVTQLPELRPGLKLLAAQLGEQTQNGDPGSLLDYFSNRVSVEDLQKQLRSLAGAAGHATSCGCSQEQFESWKYNRDLKMAIEEAIDEQVEEQICRDARHWAKFL
jgi:hypothetical protein